MERTKVLSYLSLFFPQSLLKNLWRNGLFPFLLGVHLGKSPNASALIMECQDGRERVQAEVIQSEGFYTESPHFFNNALYYVEFTRDRVMQVLGNQGKEFWSQRGCGPAAVMPYQEGFLVACYSSSRLVYLSQAGQTLREWSTPASLSSGFREMTPNDFVKDQWGGVYFTSSGEFNSDPKTPIEGRIFYLDSLGGMREVASGIHYANGIALSSDGRRLMVAEHLENRILEYPVLSPGVLGPQSQVFANLAALFESPKETVSSYLGPDGFRLSQGVFFIAQYAGSRILKVDERGDALGKIDIFSKFPNTTNVWVEGDSLYFTAVRDDAHLGHQAVYPAIVGRITDPLLFVRKQLNCDIK